MMYLEKKITKNKTFSLQFVKFEEYSYIDLTLKITSLKFEDHAGLNLTMELFGFCFILEIYDNRHAININ